MEFQPLSVLIERLIDVKIKIETGADDIGILTTQLEKCRKDIDFEAIRLSGNF